ncbi:MAG: nucleotidyltransferase domain-containing protein [Chloroflexota bacterium]
MLDRYQQETAVLLATIHETVERNGRFCAAWLFGSFGRGDNDALSDLDIWLVVEDEAYQNIVENRLAFVQQFGEVLFTIDVPHNAPPNGAYLGVSYSAPIALHHVDFYWQPRSKSVLPPQMNLLFDKVGIQKVDEPIVFPGGEPDYDRINQPLHFVPYFWMMVMASAKHLWRKPDSETVPFLPFFLPDFHKAQTYLDLPHTYGESTRCLTANAKFEYLMRLADDMQEMAKQMVAKETAVSLNVHAPVRAYLSLLQATYSEIVL